MQNFRIIKSNIIPDKWKYSIKLSTSTQGLQTTNVVNEAGLYKIIMLRTGVHKKRTPVLSSYFKYTNRYYIFLKI